MSQLSLHQRIVNAAASQEVENVKARHTYYHGRADATGEWANIWAMNDDSSWAHAFGRMRGKDQIWYGSVTQYDQMAMENWLEMFRKYPEVGGKDPRPLMEASVHTLVTDVIEVAADGKSARDLGQLIYFFEYGCGLSGYLIDVNPFDQPGVEAYKQNMFALLGKPGYEDRKAELEAKLAK